MNDVVVNSDLISIRLVLIVVIEERVIRRGERIAAAREKFNVGQEANAR